ncbi:MAG: GntR family transcriptional regulator [Chloroflexota bacterium]|nr:GntR family transcriptional regulator [Chloroflexota bacterium]
MTDGQSMVIHLRDRIISGLHRGRLHTGDRLPSVRQVAEYSGADHRTVASAYRVLEEEGLVEVRGRSGVYVAEQERLGGVLLSETGRWLATLFAEAWKRRIMVPDLPELIRRCINSVQLRTAFVESTEDHMIAFCEEINAGFGSDCQRVYLDPASDSPSQQHSQEEFLVEKLHEIDLIISTAFHSALVRKVAATLDKPLVVVSAHPDLAHAIRQRLRVADLTIVCADPRFGERVRSVYGGEDRSRIRVVRADDAWGIAQLDRAEPVLLTRAARRRLLDDVEFQMIVPHSPTLSFESAHELSEAIIRLNLNHAASEEDIS